MFSWGRKIGSLCLQLPPGPTTSPFVFPSLTFNKLHVHPPALPWVLPVGHKDFGSLLITPNCSQDQSHGVTRKPVSLDSITIYKQREQGFEEKEIWFIVHWTKRKTRRVNLKAL
jgi:hypothetical protein